MKKRIDWFDIKTILQNNHITKLYHFTDRSNLDSIVKNGGLISWGDCQEKSIYINAPGGSDLSHVLDEKEGFAVSELRQYDGRHCGRRAVFSCHRPQGKSRTAL